MEEERREHVAKMKKMEMEMEQVFEMKVKEKVQKLKDSEAEVKHTRTHTVSECCSSCTCEITHLSELLPSSCADVCRRLEVRSSCTRACS